MQHQDPHPPAPTTLAPLRNPVFRSIWTATQISSLGWLVQTVAISWLMATISASDLMVALVQAASTLPVFFLSIVAGAIADNFRRRRVMFAGHCLIALASTTLTISVGLGFVHPWLILALGFLAGCGFALTDPAWHASVGDILHKRDIPAAVTLMSVGYNIVRSVGPALGGVIMAFFGPLAAFALAALSDLAPLGAIWRTNWKVRSSPLPRERMGMAIHDGVRFTAMSLEIRAAVARATLFGLASISILALLPLVVRDQLMSGPIVYGILLAGFGTGAFIAGMSSGLLRRITSQNRLVVYASVACAACCLSLALTSSVPVAASSLALGGAGWLITWTGIDVSVQLASPRWVVGRTLSIYYALSAGGMAAGSWIWGSVAQNYSLNWALEGAAGALLLVAAAGILLPIRPWEETDQESSDFRTPELALDLKPRSGPIVAKVDYSISEKNIDAFLGCMRAKRHALSRAGARNWTLQRNLQTPSLWTETFRTPTWMDFLRLNHRLTAADKEVGHHLLALHDGELPPQTVLSIERTTEAARTRATTIFSRPR
ncbi:MULTISPECIES: MFS transporter [unclassified Mesorhizobium]|uniref:MFS transporter n=1 Tax=unclassified Mesorhizobium TaxID=325217 RepID=UPI000FD4AA8B|nr:MULTISPECIES: MFS transporter [unclassified Mesorhizobium]RUU74430.1 MFS transporter [Mesorhizobium sp. M7A.F.Ca.MR.362.00.0.0]RWN85120.1 MAG: MFS transporter [Mesorhizobium sp.]RWO96119.1 MAG: MFS transporter [Mesorhizobium sp.]TIM32502.1 MAG: MFS transporter [Mesorhizobium sp.]